MSLLSRKIGIDLGTATVLIYVKGEGIVVNEPATGRDHALGQLIAKASGRARLFRPEVAISVPTAVGLAERRAVTEAAISAGARQAWLIDEPLAAAIGAGLRIAERRANAVCDIGAAKTEIAVISESGMVVARSIPVGGRHVDQAIASALAIDDSTAEAVKVAVGSAMPMDEPLETRASGARVSTNDLVDAVRAPIRLIAAAIRDVLLETPPRLAADIRERGVVLAGGGAQLRGIAAYLAAETGVPAMVADEPQTSVVRGTGLALENFEVLKRNQSYVR
ncbi:MAG TPA: rod shape-determining protein [Candidatus Dormibacteraeota bacterium]|nr:rod shape-determining protein [Candidatus Dormibacteraeota bacterium]